MTARRDCLPRGSSWKVSPPQADIGFWRRQSSDRVKQGKLGGLLSKSLLNSNFNAEMLIYITRVWEGQEEAPFPCKQVCDPCSAHLRTIWFMRFQGIALVKVFIMWCCVQPIFLSACQSCAPAPGFKNSVLWESADLWGDEVNARHQMPCSTCPIMTFRGLWIKDFPSLPRTDKQPGPAWVLGPRYSPQRLFNLIRSPTKKKKSPKSSLLEKVWLSRVHWVFTERAFFF